MPIMKALIQRVKYASVAIDGSVISEISKGLLILLGIAANDTDTDIEYLVDKIANLRIFEDENLKMNMSLLDVKGEALIVSQFTLYADCRKGRRPSFTDAAGPAHAEAMYKKFIQKFRETGVKVAEGKFAAMMDVTLVNWGPVTILLGTC